VEPRKVFGANLRRARTAANLTQEALAWEASIHPSEISKLERGVRDPRLETIIRVARALGVPLSDLLAGLG
jgi:transcriptional regulator with XRE-family HTH domain